MKKVIVKLKKANKLAKTPVYATKGAAGFDFYALEGYVIPAGRVVKIPTGLCMEIKPGYFIKIVSRSGLAFKGIYHMESIIDSDYRGEMHFILFNTTEQDFLIEKGDRIAQGLLMPVYEAEFKEVKELSETKRGKGGFHSTGRK